MSFSSLNAILSNMDPRDQPDRDFRVMALTDLSRELSGDQLKLTSKDEKIIIQKLSNIIVNDSISEPLVARLSRENTTALIEEFLSLSLDKSSDRVAYLSESVIKSAIECMPEENLPCLVEGLIPNLVKTICCTNGDTDVESSCLDRLDEAVTRIGEHVKSVVPLIQPLVVYRLANDFSNSKRVISISAHISKFSSEKHFQMLLKHLFSELAVSSRVEGVRVFLQCVTMLSRVTGYRMVSYASKIMDLVQEYMEKYEEQECDVKELCFQYMESLVGQLAGKDVTQQLERVVDFSLKYIRYDPNCRSDDDTSDIESSEGSQDSEYGEGSVSDEEDNSWKIRRLSAKCLGAVIRSRIDLLPISCMQIAPVLVSCFQEKEENVKSEVFSSFLSFLDQVMHSNLETYNTEGGESWMHCLLSVVKRATEILIKQLRSKGIASEVRIGCIEVLTELSKLASKFQIPSPDETTEQLVDVGRNLFSLKTASSALKTRILSLFRVIVSCQLTSDNVGRHIGALYEFVKNIMNDQDSSCRCVVEAFHICEELIKLLSPEESGALGYVLAFYQITYQKYVAVDADREVKGVSTTVMTQLLLRFARQIPEESVREILNVVLDRLKDDAMRPIVAKAIEELAVSPCLPLSDMAIEISELLCRYLELQNSKMRSTFLNVLHIFAVRGYLSSASDDLFRALIWGIRRVIQREPHLADISLELAARILYIRSDMTSFILHELLDQILDFMRSHATQKQFIDGVLTFFSAVAQNQKYLCQSSVCDSLIQKLFEQVKPKATGSTGIYFLRHHWACLAQLVVVLMLDQGEKVPANLNRLLEIVESSSENSPEKHLALLALGEIGQRLDMSTLQEGGLKSIVFETFCSHLDSTEEDIKTTSALALGQFLVKNHTEYLCEILRQLKEFPGRQLSLLNVIRELITAQTRLNDITICRELDFRKLTDSLYECMSNEKESVRYLATECLGKLVAIRPETLFPEILNKANSTDALMRASVVRALQYMNLDNSKFGIDPFLEKNLELFLSMIDDQHPDVCLSALGTLNFLGHQKPRLIFPHLSSVLPRVYRHTEIKSELIQTVELGPFKYNVDTGLSLRQVAYECLLTFLSSEWPPESLNVSELLKRVIAGFSDASMEIKTLSHLLLVHLSRLVPEIVEASADLIIAPLRETLTNKVKETVVQQDKDRNDEMIRQALRSVASVDLLTGAGKTETWRAFVDSVVCQGELGKKYEFILKDVRETIAQHKIPS